MKDLPERKEVMGWVDERPFWGSVLMALGALFIAWVPLNVSNIQLLGVFVTPVGYLLALLLLVNSGLALAKPALHDVLGISGILFSLLSVFGALGGLFVGMLVGTIGGVLCYSWTPPRDRRSATDVPKDFEDI